MAALESIGVKFAAVVGGSFGSLLALSYLPRLSKWQRFGAFAGGVVCAAFLAPLVTYFLHLPSSLDAPIGFVIGIAGMGLVGWLIKAARDPIGTFTRFKKGQENE